MKIKKKKGIEGKLDIAWSKLVKIRAGMKCEYCLTTTKQLHSHHIYSRSNKSTRWDAKNGICLCAGHHVLSSKFSAHKTPVEFVEWLQEKRGMEYLRLLKHKANQVSKLHNFEKELLLKVLNKEISKHT